MAPLAKVFVEVEPDANPRRFEGSLRRQIDRVDGKKIGNQVGTRIGVGLHGAIGAAVSRSAGLFVAGFAAIEGAKIFSGFIADAQESARISRITAAAIKSTGGAAKVTAAQVGDLATAISNKTGADDEAVQSGENLLLTFTNIRNGVGKGNDIFNQASAAIVDMTAALNNGAVTSEGLKSSSIQLGKALNDPIKGVTALQKVGVSFTASQKAQIKALVDSGHTMDAQKIILRELGKEFGGAAAAAADPMTRLKVIVGNLSESIGGLLLPVVGRLANFLADTAIPAVYKFGNFVKQSFGIVRAAFNDPDITSNGFAGVLEHIGVAARRVADFLQVNVPRAIQLVRNGFVNGETDAGGFAGVLQHVGDIAFRVADFVSGTVVPALGRFAQAAGPVLLAALRAVGGFIAGTVMPALRQFGGFLIGTVFPALVRVGAFLARTFGPTFQALAETVKKDVVPALLSLWAIIQRNMPAIQAVAKALGTVIVVVLGLAAKIAGLLLPILIRLAGFLLGSLIKLIAQTIQYFGNLVRAVISTWQHFQSFLAIVSKVWSSFITASRNAIRNVVDVFLGMVSTIIQGAAKAFGWVPGLGGKLKSAAAEFDKFRARVNAALSGVKSREITVTARASVLMGQGLSRSDAIATALHRASGGPIFGPGTRTSDSVPIMASNDEHMWSAREVAGAGGHAAVGRIRKLAAAGKLAGFAAGGPVQFNVLARTSGLPRFAADMAAVDRFASDLVTGAATRAARNAAARMSTGATGRAPGAVGGNAALGRSLAAQLYGWTGGQWNALFNLWQGESGWNNNAQNPTSTAYGIAQFLNSTWGAVGASKTSDPGGQIRAGLRYIAQSYGTPANAYGKWLGRSPHWYDQGGLLPPGLSLAMNGTGRPERIRTGRQEDDLLGELRGLRRDLARLPIAQVDQKYVRRSQRYLAGRDPSGW